MLENQFGKFLMTYKMSSKMTSLLFRPGYTSNYKKPNSDQLQMQLQTGVEQTFKKIQSQILSKRGGKLTYPPPPKKGPP